MSVRGLEKRKLLSGNMLFFLQDRCNGKPIFMYEEAYDMRRVCTKKMQNRKENVFSDNYRLV